MPAFTTTNALLAELARTTFNPGHKLNNLIWINTGIEKFNKGDPEDPEGDNAVDFVATELSDSLSGSFSSLIGKIGCTTILPVVVTIQLIGLVEPFI